MTLLQLALHNLLRRRARTALTVIAVALGIAAIVALTGIAWGFEASWQKANDSRGTDLIVTRVASENSMPSPFLAEANARTLKAMPHVQDVVGLLSEMLSVSADAPPVFVFGWAWDSYLWKHLQLVRGRWPASDLEASVVLGSIAADLLHKGPGDELEIEGRSFKVVGIFESPAVIENGALIVTLSQAQQVTDKPGKVNVLNIKLDGDATQKDADAIKARVRATMPGYIAFTSGELVRQNAIVRIAKAMSDATILVASLVGTLVVFNTMLMSVNERTREVGILQAVGWHSRTIVRLIVSEAMLLTLTGGVLGCLLGICAAVGMSHLDLMRGKIDAVFSPLFLASVLALSALLGIAGGLLPAIKASRMLPARALRHE
jgi:putative ABC transport system permease protein